MITLEQAKQITTATIERARELRAAPLTVAVLDTGGHLVVLHREDNSGILRPQIAIAKAWGALGMGLSSRELGRRAELAPNFFSALSVASEGRIAPAPGGVLIRSDGVLIGAVGVSGDTSDVDEACAIAAVIQAGLDPDPDAALAV
jgi:uncharacterized protein GlcG (DUF336 family)